MDTVIDNGGEKVTTLNSNNRMMVTDADGKQYYLIPADAAKALMSLMPVATPEAKGLMSANYAKNKTYYCSTGENATKCTFLIAKVPEGRRISFVLSFGHVTKPGSVYIISAGLHFSSPNNIIKPLKNLLITNDIPTALLYRRNNGYIEIYLSCAGSYFESHISYLTGSDNAIEPSKVSVTESSLIAF